MELDALPRPPVPNLERNDQKQSELASKHAPQNKHFSRAYAVLSELERLELTAHQRQDKAEALANLGRFDEAAELGTSQSDFYREVWDAVWKDDGDSCDCPEFKARGLVAEEGRVKERSIILGKWFTLREVYSVKHGQICPLKRCSKCGYLNVFE